VYRVVKTMESVGYLVEDRTTSHYHVGPATVALNFIDHGWPSEIVAAACPYLEDLAAQTAETINLAVYVDGVAVEVHEISTSRPFRRKWAPGRIIGYPSAHGKILAAFTTGSTQQTVLAPAYYRPTIDLEVPADPIIQELEQVRQDGFAFSMEERDIGTCAVAAPVRDQVGALVGSVAVLAPPGRFGERERQLHAQAVKTVAAAISTFLGYFPRAQGV
jgi:DNA-binding IclR family transcriptional regulator